MTATRPTQTATEAPPIVGELGNRPLPERQEKREEGFVFTQEQIELIKDTVARDQNLTDSELRLFLYVAQRRRLDPLAKQIYAVRRKGKVVFQTSIDGFRLIAARTGEYAGRDAPAFTGGLVDQSKGKTAPEMCSVTVYRLVQGQRSAFTASSRFAEFLPESESESFMWRNKPFLMLAKVTEAQALRAAFPEELGSLYTDDEMEQAGPSDAQRAAQAETVATHTDPLTLSLNTPLPGAAGGWGGYAKAPLSSVPSEILVAVVDWATDKALAAKDKLATATAATPAADVTIAEATVRRMGEIQKRCAIVLEAREAGEVAEPPHKDGTPREGKAEAPTTPPSSNGEGPAGPATTKTEPDAAKKTREPGED